jgi:hypothetical protein
MPRQQNTETTLDDLLREIFFTRAALAADEDAVDLLPMTDGWEPGLDALQAKQRASMRAQLGADALRRVTNGRLDDACTAFGSEFGLRNKPETPEWRLYFRNTTLSRFVRQAFATQVGAVEAWLATSAHPVFEAHREAITRTVQAARRAIIATEAAAVPLGEWQIARATFAEDMTRERDGLWAALDERRRARNLPREWPDMFFRVESSDTGKAAAAADPVAQ